MFLKRILRMIPLIGLLPMASGVPKGINISTKEEIIELPGFESKMGGHCESTAMLNALKYQGLEISECMINGLASSAAFAFLNDQFPLVGGRANTLLENFIAATNIRVVAAHPQNPQEAYEGVKELLKRQIPVVLRVDMRYLPYRYGGRYGDKYTSFGWHFVTLFKLDEKEGYAYVVERDFKEPQKIRLSDLAKARNSKEGRFHADNYFYYFDKPSLVKIDYKEAFRKSVFTLIKNYEMPDGGLKGIEGFSADIENIEYGRNVFILKPVFHVMYGYIEEFGTGGSAFRNFLRDYLLEMGALLKNDDIIAAAAIVEDSCIKWRELALEFKNISEVVDSLRKNKAKRQEIYKIASTKAKEVYKSEEGIYKKLKELYSKI